MSQQNKDTVAQPTRDEALDEFIGITIIALAGYGLYRLLKDIRFDDTRGQHGEFEGGEV